MSRHFATIYDIFCPVPFLPSPFGFRRLKKAVCGLRRENPGAFRGPIFQQPFSLPENAQTLAGIAFRAAGKSVKNFPAASKWGGGNFFTEEFRTATAFSSFLIVCVRKDPRGDPLLLHPFCVPNSFCLDAQKAQEPKKNKSILNGLVS